MRDFSVGDLNGPLGCRLQLSYRMLARYRRGEGVPTVKTIRTIVRCIDEAVPRGPSTIDALSRPYPGEIIRILIGLTLIGNNGYVAPFNHTGKRARWDDWQRGQKPLAEKFIEIVKPYLSGDYPNGRAGAAMALAAVGRVQDWLLGLEANPELLAICIAFAYFGDDWTDEDFLMRIVLDWWHPRLEGLYKKAGDAYDERGGTNLPERVSQLVAAGKILQMWELDPMTRHRAIAPVLRSHAQDFALTFHDEIWGAHGTGHGFGDDRMLTTRKAILDFMRDQETRNVLK